MAQDLAKKFNPFGGGAGGGGLGLLKKQIKAPNAQAALERIEEAKEEAAELAAEEAAKTKAKQKARKRGGGCTCFDDW